MRSEETGWCRHLAPLGVPTAIIANDSHLLAAACAAYADWLVEAPTDRPVIELRLERGSASPAHVSCAISVEGSRLTLSGEGISGYADAISRQAWCRVPPCLIDDPAALAAEAIDTLLLFLLARSGRTPVHAAGVLFGDTVAMLSGASGAGKSTLALAAVARGLPILSDDTLYVQIDPCLRVWGFARPIHVFAQDAPEGVFATRLRGGKLKNAIPVSAGATISPVADAAVLILLDKGPRLSLDRIDTATAIERLTRLEPGFDLLRAESAAAIRALAEPGAWQLTLTDDPGEAIDFLGERFRSIAPRR